MSGLTGQGAGFCLPLDIICSSFLSCLGIAARVPPSTRSMSTRPRACWRPGSRRRRRPGCWPGGWAARSGRHGVTSPGLRESGRVAVPDEGTVFTVRLPGAAGRRGAGARPGVRAHGLLGRRPGAGGVPRPVPTGTVRAGEGAGGGGGVRLLPSCRRGNVSGLRHLGAAAAGQDRRVPAGKEEADDGAAIYARVSSARQAKDETIGSQLSALREHAAASRLDVPEEWVFADEGHSGATLVRPGPGGAAGPGRPGLPGRGAGLLPGPAGPQVRLPGAFDRGARPLRDPGGVREGTARRQPRGPAAGPVPGHVRRVREGPADGALPARQGLAGQDRQRERARGRPVRLPVRPQDPGVRGPLRGDPARGRAGGGDVPPLRRRRRRHRRPGPLAHRARRAHPHRQGTLGPVA